MKEFEDLIADIGMGKYQKRLLYIVLSPLFFLLPLSWVNEIFLLHTPSHWCFHPAQEGLDADQLAEWKKCYMPEDYLADGTMGPSPCKMILPPEFKDREDEFWKATSLDGCPTKDPANINNTISCNLGYTFDQSEFLSTAVTANDWVCDRGQYIPQLFTWGLVGTIVGTFIFSYLGDAIGRRTTFWITTALIVIFMTGKTFLSEYFEVYVAFKVVAAASYFPTYQMPFAIITEVSDADYRSWAVGVSCILWTAGLCFLPLIGWLSKEWVTISLVTVLPMALLFFGWKLVPESPRWLLSKGRKEAAKKILVEIAEVNNKPPVKNLDARLDKIVEIMRNEKSYGYLSLFTSARLAMKTFLITVALVASNFLYYQLMLNIGNMAGNTFLNFFLLGVIEAPACFLAVWISEYLGRRWSHTLLLIVNTLSLLVNAIIANRPELSIVVTVFCLISKFICTATFIIVYVQCIEIFPTCIRNTGMGFTLLACNIIGVAGPYVVYLGTTDTRIPYGIMGLMCLFGAIAASFLPETVGVALPETLGEATKFGEDQKYFSWIRKNDNHRGNGASKNEDDEESVKQPLQEQD